MPLVIYALGDGQTHTHTHAYRRTNQSNFKKPGTCGLQLCAAGLKIVNLKKGIGIERYTQFTTVTLIYEKVPKQDEQVKLLCILIRLQVKIKLKGYYICNKN